MHAGCRLGQRTDRQTHATSHDEKFDLLDLPTLQPGESGGPPSLGYRPQATAPLFTQTGRGQPCGVNRQ